MLQKAGVSSFEEVLTKTADELFPPATAEEIRACDEAVLAGEHLIEESTRIDRPDGTVRWYEGSKVPYYDSNDNIVGIVGICRDTTDERIQQESLKQLARLEAVDTLIVSLKHDFLYELLGATRQAILDTPNEIEFMNHRQEWCDTMAFLQAYVEQLQWWIPRRGEPSMDLNNAAPQTLAEIVDQASYWAGKYLSKPIVDNRVPSDFTVYGDRVQLQLLLFNLIHNAKRFTLDAQASIPIIVEIAVEDERVIISVDDPGCGLPKDLDPDSLTDMGVSRNPDGHTTAGSGFGLFLCRKIVEAHEGKWIQPTASDRGGALFKFSLPKRYESRLEGERKGTH